MPGGSPFLKENSPGRWKPRSGDYSPGPEGVSLRTGEAHPLTAFLGTRKPHASTWHWAAKEPEKVSGLSTSQGDVESKWSTDEWVLHHQPIWFWLHSEWQWEAAMIPRVLSLAHVGSGDHTPPEPGATSEGHASLIAWKKRQRWWRGEVKAARPVWSSEGWKTDMLGQTQLSPLAVLSITSSLLLLSHSAVSDSLWPHGL